MRELGEVRKMENVTGRVELTWDVGEAKGYLPEHWSWGEAVREAGPHAKEALPLLVVAEIWSSSLDMQ
jgi:hypothetical protein